MRREQSEIAEAPAHVVTTVRIKREVWLSLRALAHGKALASGRRTSASGVIEDLVQEATRQRAVRVDA